MVICGFFVWFQLILTERTDRAEAVSADIDIEDEAQFQAPYVRLPWRIRASDSDRSDGSCETAPGL